jgi:hypothetical protein
MAEQIQLRRGNYHFWRRRLSSISDLKNWFMVARRETKKLLQMTSTAAEVKKWKIKIV